MESAEIKKTKVAAGKITERLDNGSWTDTTFENLMSDCHLDPLDFHSGLSHLLEENKVFLFETKKDTYVFPKD